MESKIPIYRQILTAKDVTFNSLRCCYFGCRFKHKGEEEEAFKSTFSLQKTGKPMTARQLLQWEHLERGDRIQFNVPERRFAKHH